MVQSYYGVLIGRDGPRVYTDWIQVASFQLVQYIPSLTPMLSVPRGG